MDSREAMGQSTAVMAYSTPHRSLRSTHRILVCALISAASFSCDRDSARGVRGAPEVPSDNQTLSREDREILDAAKRKKAELKDLRAHPNRFIQMEQWNSFDKGIINDYTEVTEVKMTNSSSFDVRDITGEFTYMSKQKEVMATVPIKLEGELRAGETKELKASTRTISGKAHGGTLTVKSVTVRE